jgi:profilin
MNQLQNLLHDALIATSHVEKAALLNKDDYSIKAASVGFILQDQDVENFIDAFQNTAMARDRGLFFDDVNYTCLRADEDSIYAKNVNIFNKHINLNWRHLSFYFMIIEGNQIILLT